jgi:hypothetical protein
MSKSAGTRPEWGWWREQPVAVRQELRRFYRGLKARWGPFDAVEEEHARLSVETWWAAREASGAAITEGVKRRYGKGRRPNQPALDRRFKRQGLGVATFDQMLRRLEDLSGGAKRDLGRALRERLG